MCDYKAICVCVCFLREKGLRISIKIVNNMIWGGYNKEINHLSRAHGLAYYLNRFYTVSTNSKKLPNMFMMQRMQTYILGYVSKHLLSK